MAKKKKTSTSVAQKPLTPEQYIKTKARQLPITKCYKMTVPESGLMNIYVIRQHPKGTLTMGVYLVDTWCVGVKDTTWLFNVAKEEIDDLMSQMGAMLPEEITYDEAHNWIYGALAFAEEVGIKPHQDFAVAQYILEEDDDNIPLIEYEFGRNGRYCLVSHGTLEASHYRPALNKHLGPDGYDLIVNNSPHPYADRYDYNSDEDESMDFFKEYRDLPRMKHTYTGKDYPKDIILHHPEIEPIVSKDMETITDEEIHSVLNLPADTLREDLHNLVLRELYRQTIKGKDNRRKNWQIIGNAFMFLVKVGNVESTLPIVLEVLRQDEDVITYNFGDFASCLLTPPCHHPLQGLSVAPHRLPPRRGSRSPCQDPHLRDVALHWPLFPRYSRRIGRHVPASPLILYGRPAYPKHL